MVNTQCRLGSSGGSHALLVGVKIDTAVFKDNYGNLLLAFKMQSSLWLSDATPRTLPRRYTYTGTQTQVHARMPIVITDLTKRSCFTPTLKLVSAGSLIQRNTIILAKNI